MLILLRLPPPVHFVTSPNMVSNEYMLFHSERPLHDISCYIKDSTEICVGQEFDKPGQDDFWTGHINYDMYRLA